MFNKRTSFDTNDLESVIAACIEQNASAQRVLFKQFFGFAKSVCLRYCANTEEAEDVLSEGRRCLQNHNSGSSRSAKYGKSRPGRTAVTQAAAAPDNHAPERHRAIGRWPGLGTDRPNRARKPY